MILRKINDESHGAKQCPRVPKCRYLCSPSQSGFFLSCFSSEISNLGPGETRVLVSQVEIHRLAGKSHSSSSAKHVSMVTSRFSALQGASQGQQGQDSMDRFTYPDHYTAFFGSKQLDTNLGEK